MTRQQTRTRLSWRTWQALAPGKFIAQETVVCDKHRDPWTAAAALLGVALVPTTAMADEPCWQCVPPVRPCDRSGLHDEIPEEGDVTDPAYRALIEVDGESLHDIAMRLEDIALRLQEPGRRMPVSIVGAYKIVTVRPVEAAPSVTWNP